VAKPILWAEATLATMGDGGFGLIPNGALLVEDGRIAWIGESGHIPFELRQRAEYISVKGALITPGLIDCHTHLVYAGNRANEWAQRLSGKSYEELTHEKKGIYSTVAATRAIDEKTLLEISLKRAKAMLQEGVTTLEIKSGYGLDLATERKILRVAKQIEQKLPLEVQTTFLGAHVLPEEFSSKADYIEYLIKEVLPPLIAENLIDAVDGFCETVAFSEVELDPLFVAAKQNNLKLKIHTDQLYSSKGTSLIAKYQGISADHLEYLDEAGVKILKNAEVVAVLLPGAHYFLQQQQCPPIALFREHGVSMAIATDCNPGTSPTTSLLLMMNMACIEYGLTPLEALQGVTLHAAKALNLKKGQGQLAVGSQADFVVWDCEQPIELSYYFGSRLCLQVIKKGEVVYEA